MENLRKRIETTYYAYGYDSKGCKLANCKNEFHFKGIEFWATKGGLFKIAFNCTNVPDNDSFDFINSKYHIHVHHGDYQDIKYDISNCYDPDTEKKKQFPNNAYYSCDGLDEQSAVELFDYLYKLNNI